MRHSLHSWQGTKEVSTRSVLEEDSYMELKRNMKLDSPPPPNSGPLAVECTFWRAGGLGLRYRLADFYRPNRELIIMKPRWTSLYSKPSYVSLLGSVGDTHNCFASSLFPLGARRHVPCALCPGFHVPGPSFHVPGPTFHVQAFISQNIRPIQIGYTTITLFIS